MAPQYDTIDLSRLALSPGEGRRIEGQLRPAPLDIGGQRYGPAGDLVAYRLDVSRTNSGHAFRLWASAALAGPCMRCLEAAEVPVEADAREVSEPTAGDEELISPYVDGDVLDLASWLHDALALGAPAQFLCRPDCLGLCPECGEPRNDADPDQHRHAEAAGPFAGLGDLLGE